MSKQIPLSDVLTHITEELVKADENARKRGRAAMRFDECELEFAVQLEGGGEAGVKVWVLELGVNAKRTDSNTIRIKFKSLSDSPLQAPHFDTSTEGPALERQVGKHAD